MKKNKCITIDLDEVKTSKDLRTILIKKLGFPSYFSNNWDAFWDLIRDLVEMPEKVIFLKWDKLNSRLPEDAEALKEVLDVHNIIYPNLKYEIEYK